MRCGTEVFYSICSQLCSVFESDTFLTFLRADNISRVPPIRDIHQASSGVLSGCYLIVLFVVMYRLQTVVLEMMVVGLKVSSGFTFTRSV
jgi:hypothetical protein